MSNEPRKKTNYPISYPLRLEHSLREELETKARKNGRSLNTEIVMMLEKALKNDVLQIHPNLIKDLEQSAKMKGRSLNAEVSSIIFNHFNAERTIIDAINNEDPQIKSIIKLTMAELLDDLLKEKNITINNNPSD